MKSKTYLGYYFNPNHNFQSGAVIFWKDDNKITVGMLQSALDYALDILANEDNNLERIKTTITVLKFLKVVLSNKKMHKPSKEDFKTTLDVITEIANKDTTDEKKKQKNKDMCFCCKLMIDLNYREND